MSSHWQIAFAQWKTHDRSPHMADETLALLFLAEPERGVRDYHGLQLFVRRTPCSHVRPSHRCSFPPFVCGVDFRPQFFGGGFWVRQAKPPMNYSKRGPEEARFHSLCITKASAGYLKSTAVSSSIIKVRAFLCIFAPPPPPRDAKIPATGLVKLFLSWQSCKNNIGLYLLMPEAAVWLWW